MSKTTLEVLIDARKLIEKPENWTQGANALTAKSHFVSPNHKAAACWCAFGAIQRARGSDEFGTNDAVIAVERHSGWLEKFNDSHTHSEVLAMFDRAIEAERAKAVA